MSLVEVNGHAVFGGTITLPLIGVWTADLAIDAEVELGGSAQIAIQEGETLVGTVVAGDIDNGYLRARIVGGAAGLTKRATPKHYETPQLRVVLGDLAKSAGETLSSTIAAAALGTSMRAWTVLGLPLGLQVAALVCSALPGSSWRILADGTLWVGTEAWPESDVQEWRELERVAGEARLELGLDAPSLLPGTVLGDDRIEYVQYRIEQRGVRTTAWLA